MPSPGGATDFSLGMIPRFRTRHGIEPQRGDGENCYGVQVASRRRSRKTAEWGIMPGFPRTDTEKTEKTENTEGAHYMA